MKLSNLTATIALAAIASGALIVPMAGACAQVVASPSKDRSQQHASRPAAIRTGHYTYAGHGTVNTHWIETPTSVIVIDTQRDTTHAGEALEAVKALGKPVTAIFVTHGHPDHYTGLEQFLAEWPRAKVYASPETIRIVETDSYGYHKLVKELTPDEAPDKFVVPNTPITANTTLLIDGVEIVTHEMGPSESDSATVLYLPSTGDIYLGDLVLNRMHGFFLENRSAELLATLQKLRVLFPNAETAHPGHGEPGPFGQLIDRQEDYTVTARRLTASALADGLTSESADRKVRQALIVAYPDYGVPGGQPDMIELSVKGLRTELIDERSSLPANVRQGRKP